MKNNYLIFILTILFTINFSFNSVSQTTGDYRSVTTGNWTALSTWQRWSGSAWVTPTSGQGYPGQNVGTGAVLIQTGHTVTMGNGTAGGAVSTQLMGTLTIQSNGKINLFGASSMVIFYINTLVIDVASGGTIYFINKCQLKLTTDAVVSVIIGSGALTGDCNNNNEIMVGTQKFAACAGAPGDIFTFAQLMASGGTLNALPTSNSPLCQGSTINLTGNYAGAIGTAPTYSWSVTFPGAGSPTVYTTKDVSIPNAVTGTYSAKLTVTSVLNGTTYTNCETINVVVNALPTLSGATQPITVCNNTPATIQLTGLVPSTTFTVNYKINNVVQTPVSGLISNASGTSSFNTANLVESNNGQILQITGITITNPSTNCAQTFTQNVTMSVYTTGAGTWKGTTSSDWNVASNWCGGVPAASTDVYINPNSASVLNQPVIGAAGGTCNSITINASASLTINGSNTLEVKANWTNNGTFTPNTSTVSFTGSAEAQTIGGSGVNTFNNLTINNSYSGGGVKAGSNITVNGVLNMAAANPSATVGALEMVTAYNNYPRTTGSNSYNAITSYILTMGPNATTTGIGDVTGKIYRSSLNANTTYSFGNQFTNFAYTVAPTDVTLIVTIGTAYGDGSTWGYSSAVQRSYEMIPTGGAGAKVTMNLHYLDSELQSNTEINLVTGDFDVEPAGAPLGDEHGRSSYDNINNYIGLTGVPIDYFIYSDPDHKWKTIFNLHDYSTGHTVWDGSESSSWMNDLNWSNGIPGEAMTAIIPDAASTPNDPILAAGKTIGGMQILSGGILNLNGQTITINASTYGNGWEDQSGLSNYAGSTVIIANTSWSTPVLGMPHFDNLTINSGAGVTIQSNSHVYISGTLTKSGSFDANTFENTLEYNGAAQSIVLPDVSNMYYNLILSGSGTKTLPVTLSVSHNLNLTGSSDASGTTLNVGGNFTNSSSGVFSIGTVNLNGTTTQTIGGTTSTTFSDLTLNNANGAILGINETIDGIFTLTNGLITTGSYTLTIGCNGSISGANASRFIDGKLARIYCGTGSKDFPIGKGGNYRQLTLNYSALNGTSTVTAEQFESTIGGSLPANHMVQSGRYWSISQTGGSSFTYSLNLNGSPYDPGVASPKILHGDGSSNTASAATFSSPNFTSTGLSTFSSYYAVGTECVPPSIDLQPASTSTCDGLGTPTFSVTASGGTLSYEWQESVTGTGGTFNTIYDGGVYSNSTSSDLTITNPPISMNGYAYRVIITRLCGSSTTSDGNAVLTVNAIPTISLGASPSVCNGVPTAELNYSGVTGTPDQYKIDYDTDAEGAGFSDVSYTNLTSSPVTLNVPSTAGTYNGTLYVKNTTSTCESIGYPFTVTIYSLPQGSLSGNSICSGETGQLMWTATEGNGPFTIVYNDGADHTATDVYSGVPFNVYSSQTATKVYTLVSVTGTHCTRTTGFSGGSGTVTVLSSGLWLGAVSTDWNNADNWCGGVPTASTDVVIPSGTVNKPHVTTEDAVCQSLTINSSDSLIIEAGKSLSVSGTITNNGLLIIASSASGTGSLVDHGITGNGSIIYQKYLSTSNAYGWIIAAPVVQADNSVFAGSLGVYYYNPLTPGWSLYNTGNMENMRGYWTKFSSNKTIEFFGELNSGSQTFSNFYRTVGFTQGNMGWNFIGNPYPSAINWDDVVALAANGSGYGNGFLTETKLNSAVYISDNNGGYLVYNNGTGTFDGTIPAATAFWIQVNKDYGYSYSPIAGAELTFDNSVRLIGTGSKKTSQNNIFKLSLQNDINNDQLIIGLKNGATLQFDYQFDAIKMLSQNTNTPQIYSITDDNEKLAINCISDIPTQHSAINLGFVKGLSSSLTINALDLSSVDSNISIYLEDKLENKMINLKTDNTYTFTSLATQDDERFILHLGPMSTANISDNLAKDNISAYFFENALYVNQSNEFSILSIFNTLGQEILKRDLHGSGLHKVIVNVPTGNYIVTLISSGSTLNRKIFIK